VVFGGNVSNQNYPQQHPYSDASSDPVPLWAPYYGAPVTVAVKRFFTKYAVFSGRASRSEFWWWALVSFVVSFLLAGLDALIFNSTSQPASSPSALAVLTLLGTLVLIVPTIALTVRRLHDSNKSGWLYLLTLIPVVGSIVVLILAVLPSNPSSRRYDRPDDVPTPTNNKGLAFR
jgi:uncharacterized membrane protein YhaH (DUF805 family)